MARRTKGEKPDKKTPTKVRPIPRKHAGKITEPWKIMEDLIAEKECFRDLVDAKIKLWWQKDWKADVDGIATGAQVCKASEIDRNLVEESSGETVDLFIKLPEAQWPALDDTEKRQRLFHELCHIRQAKNSDGKQKRDAKDRLLWRLRRHPITAFHEEINEFGIKRVIGHNEAVMESIRHTERPMETLFDAAEKKSNGNGLVLAPDWRSWLTDILDMPPGKLAMLNKAGLDTIGKLMDAMRKEGQEDFWWKSIKGFGELGYDALTEAIARLRKARPDEFQVEEK
jgi:hypothetical protein